MDKKNYRSNKSFIVGACRMIGEQHNHLKSIMSKELGSSTHTGEPNLTDRLGSLSFKGVPNGIPLLTLKGTNA